MPGQTHTGSDVTRLLAQIQSEYESAVYGLSGVACGTATHQFITARMERMGKLHRELEHLVGEEEAIGLFVQALEDGENGGVAENDSIEKGAGQGGFLARALLIWDVWRVRDCPVLSRTFPDS